MLDYFPWFLTHGKYTATDDQKSAPAEFVRRHLRLPQLPWQGKLMIPIDSDQ